MDRIRYEFAERDAVASQLEAMIQADNILNDLGRESVAFVQR